MLFCWFNLLAYCLARMPTTLSLPQKPDTNVAKESLLSPFYFSRYEWIECGCVRACLWSVLKTSMCQCFFFLIQEMVVCFFAVTLIFFHLIVAGGGRGREGGEVYAIKSFAIVASFTLFVFLFLTFPSLKSMLETQSRYDFCIAQWKIHFPNA